MEPHFKLSEDEFVMRILNEHWIVFVRPILLYLLSLGLGALFYSMSLSLSEYPKMAAFFFTLMVGGVFLATHGFFIFLLRRNLSGWVVTNKRIVEFRFAPYLQHDVDHVQLFDINEINKNKHGLLENIFDYGSVVMRGRREIVYRYVPQPSRFVNLIETLKNMREFSEEDIDKVKALY